jgi:hypothetical protein
MSAVAHLPLVDGFDLPEAHRQLLRPGELMPARNGDYHRLPRFFYTVESSAVAVNTQLTPHFSLWEFIEVDLHEPALLRSYPRYVPCAVTMLAMALEVFRTEVGVPVRIAANGGYRSPAHAGSASGSPHCWATAANIYSIGSDYVDSAERINRYSEIAARTLAGCWTRPYGSNAGEADDHLHVDLGFLTLVPRPATEAGEA